MLGMIFIIVFCTAIVGVFSQEFIRLFKRIYAIPGAALLLPMIGASLIIEINLAWSEWILRYIRWLFQVIEQHVLQAFPGVYGARIFFRVMLLSLLSSIPLVIHWLLNRKKRVPDPTNGALSFSALLWIISVILMVSAGR